MSKNLNNEVMLGGFIVLAGGLLAYMSIAVGGFNLQSGVHVKAKFTNASGLVKDAAVSVAGVEVGHVEGMSVEHDKAVVNIFLRKDAGIRADVKAAIRAKSLLGEKYLELAPQSQDAPALKDGDLIADTRATVEVDELLASLAPLMKQVDPKDVATIVKGVAKTIGDEQGSLAKVVRNAADASQDVKELLANNREKIARTVGNLDRMTADGSALLTTNKGKIDRTVANVDKMAGVWSAESPALVRKASRIATNVERVSGAVGSERLARIAANADLTLQKTPAVMEEFKGLRPVLDRTLGKVNPLLDKANSVTEADVKNMAGEVLLRGGMRVYMHPFQPPEPASYQKIPVPNGETVKP